MVGVFLFMQSNLFATAPLVPLLRAVLAKLLLYSVHSMHALLTRFPTCVFCRECDVVISDFLKRLTISSCLQHVWTQGSAVLVRGYFIGDADKEWGIIRPPNSSWSLGFAPNSCHCSFSTEYAYETILYIHLHVQYRCTYIRGASDFSSPSICVGSFAGPFLQLYQLQVNLSIVICLFLGHRKGCQRIE